MAVAFAAAEPLEVILKPDDETRICEKLRRAGVQNFRHHLFETDDSWARDTLPSFVHQADGTLAAVDWIFNAWGGKYPPWERDAAVARFVSEQLEIRHLDARLVFEGGGLETDGRGTLLTTESVILNPRRNPDLTRAEAEAAFERWLGTSTVVWLPEGLDGDDTDGHIDDIARFVEPGLVACAREPNTADPNHERLEACQARLRNARDARGQRLDIIDLPMPPAIEVDSERLPASYANFYIANHSVFVPVFGEATDDVALKQLEAVFSERTIVPVPSRTLVRGLGSVHCLTQQEPEPSSA